MIKVGSANESDIRESVSSIHKNHDRFFVRGAVMSGIGTSLTEEVKRLRNDTRKGASLTEVLLEFNPIVKSLKDSEMGEWIWSELSEPEGIYYFCGKRKRRRLLFLSPYRMTWATFSFPTLYYPSYDLPRVKAVESVLVSTKRPYFCTNPVGDLESNKEIGIRVDCPSEFTQDLFDKAKIQPGDSLMTLLNSACLTISPANITNILTGVKKKLYEYFDKILLSQVPSTVGDHEVEARTEGKGEVLGVLDLIEGKLRKTIHKLPTEEREINDALENLFVVAGLEGKFTREVEHVPYSTKSYVPDFAFNQSSIAVEGKLCNTKEREKQIIDEINADIAGHKGRYSNLIFVVYDVGGFIRDEDEFRRSFEQHVSVFVKVIKH